MSIETHRGNFVVLRAGALHLVLPQEDVGAAEHGEAGQAGEVVAPSELLQALGSLPADRFVLTRLAGGTKQYAWSELKVIPDAQLQVHPLPEVLRMKNGPIDGFVEFQGTIAFRTDARRVVAYLEQAQG